MTIPSSLEMPSKKKDKVVDISQEQCRLWASFPHERVTEEKVIQQMKDLSLSPTELSVSGVYRHHRSERGKSSKLLNIPMAKSVGAVLLMHPETMELTGVSVNETVVVKMDGLETSALCWPLSLIGKGECKLRFPSYAKYVDDLDIEKGSKAVLEKITSISAADKVYVRVDHKFPIRLEKLVESTLKAYLHQSSLQFKSGYSFAFALNNRCYTFSLTTTDFTFQRIRPSTLLVFEFPSNQSTPLVLPQKPSGLAEPLEQLSKLINNVLYHPSKFTNLSVRVPRGVLLYGPPGTGKTMFVRWLSSQHENVPIQLFTVNGSEIIGNIVGESESALQNVFEQAVKNKPSIIFIDEADALFPVRSDNSEMVHQRLVAKALTFLDGAMDNSTKDEYGTYFIAATNRPEALDPALRRPGRLDTEIELSIPNLESRYEILKTLLKSSSIDANQILKLAQVSHGFVGADLKAVIREAILHRADSPLDLSFEDLQVGMSKVKPSALREFSIEVPKTLWSDIGGQWELKKQLKEAVELPLTHPEVFLRMGIRPPKGILMYGPPGTGKTLLARAIATESSMNFVAVKGPELLSKWVGESEKAVRSVFSKARAASPTVLFFDEIDSIASKRSMDSSSSSSVIGRVLSQLLIEMDGITSSSGGQIVVIAATNRPEILDHALMRPGRFDRKVYVGLPDLNSRREIFALQLEKFEIFHEIDLKSLAELSEGYSGAEIAALCREAVMECEDRGEILGLSHFDLAFQIVKPRIDEKEYLFA